MSDILRQICDDKRIEVESLKREMPLTELRLKVDPLEGRPFRSAIAGTNQVNIIAEIKKASPSKGVLIEEFDPSRLAMQYRDGGAKALSVLTERKYFHGDPVFMKQAKDVSGLPVLCKDFVVDAYQLYDARCMQADAVLLIVAALSAQQLSEYFEIARSIGLDCLVEIHDEDDLQRAVDAKADIIGVNNRNLKDFSVDLSVSERLAKSIPPDVVRVSESGIFGHQDISRLREADYHCFLIGEALVRSDDPSALMREMISA